jgi:hypothetical protein
VSETKGEAAVLRLRRNAMGPDPRSERPARGRHAALGRRRLRGSWRIVLPIGVVGLMIVGGVAVGSPIERFIRYKVAAPITVQALGIDATNPPVGQVVTVGAKIVAERRRTYDQAVFVVRDQAGKSYDFPGVGKWSVGTRQKELRASRSFDRAGVYTYWVGLQKSGRWINLEPKQTFTVVADDGIGPNPSPRPTAPSPSPAKPTPSPSATTTSAPPPVSTGFPNAGNTGVRAGTDLTVVTGDQTFSTSGAVISGKDFRGFVRVTGSNITFKNSIFRGRATGSNAALLDTERGTNTVVEDSEFVPSNPSATIDGIWANSTKIYRVDVRGSVDGIKTGNDVLIQDSYIHDMSWFASDPNQGGGETHNDGVQSFHGDARVTLRHNTIDMASTKNANAALQSSAKDSRVENNWLDGGGCTLNFNHVSGTLTGLAVVNNRFGRHSFFKCPILLSTQSVLSENSGNIWDDTGTAIPSPQRHD